MVMQGIPVGAEMPVEAPVGAVAPEAPTTAPAELDAELQAQQGVSPEQKRQLALQKLLRLRAAIDQMIRILQGQQQGQPAAWMQQEAAQQPSALRWAGGGG